MTRVKDLRKKAPARSREKARLLSTSEARANFAATLDHVRVECAIIGFDRHGRPAGILAPMEAALMLAGLGHEVDARKREAIIESALLFAHNMPGRKPEPPARGRAASGRAKTRSGGSAPKKKKTAKRRRKTMSNGI